MDLNTINWLNGGKYRVSILRILEKNPTIPSKIAKELDISRVSVTRILNDLKSENLISETSKRSRTKTYFLLKKGTKILEELQNE